MTTSSTESAELAQDEGTENSREENLGPSLQEVVAQGTSTKPVAPFGESPSESSSLRFLWDLSRAIAAGDLPTKDGVTSKRAMFASQNTKSEIAKVSRTARRRRSIEWNRAAMVVAAMFIALAAWIGLVPSDRQGDSAKNTFQSNMVHAASTNGSLDLTDQIGSTDGSGWQMAKANIEDIRVGMRVPAHNPQLSDEDREAQQFTVDSKTWRTFKLTVDKEDGTGDLEVTLLRPASWLVDELDCTALLALLSESEEALGGTADLVEKVPAWQRGLNWLGEASHVDPLAELASLAVDTPSVLRANRVENLAYPGLLFAYELADAVRTESLEQAQAELDYTSAIDSVLAGEGVGAQVYLEMPELGAVGLATVTAIDVCPQVKNGPGQTVTATFKHASADVLDLMFAPCSSSSLSLQASSLSLGVTAAHPFWSVDREDFIPAGELQLGEQVVGIDGQHFRLTSITSRAGPETVYNFEVAIDHVYYVGDGGLLVHNAYVSNLIKGKKWLSKAKSTANLKELGRAGKNLKKFKNGPDFPNLSSHARRHSDLHPNGYYNQAVINTQVGRKFRVLHDGQSKIAHVTRLGEDSFLFTSRSTSGNTILTHMSVDLQYLLNKGITLPNGF